MTVIQSSPVAEPRPENSPEDAGNLLKPNFQPRPARPGSSNRPARSSRPTRPQGLARPSSGEPRSTITPSTGNASRPARPSARPRPGDRPARPNSRPSERPERGDRPSRSSRSDRPLRPRKGAPTAATAAFNKPEVAKQLDNAPIKRGVLRIIPLGGSGETGDKNMLAYEYNDTIMIIDAGVKFPEADMHGIDSVICDTTYLEERKDRVKAIVVTHGHEDHIGGLPFIWPKFQVPIYTAPLTAGLIKSKFEEHGISGYQFRIILPNQKVTIGEFEVEAVRMTHSIPDILGLAITTPVGLIYHATDWKIDFTPAFGEPTDFTKLAELAQRGVLCLLSDSTNVLKPGYTMSEKVVGETLTGIFAESKGRIIVSSFASRIDRIQHVISAAAKTNRRVAASGRSMEKNINIALELGYLKVPSGVLTDIRNINQLPDDKVVVMCTGSQGEEFSSLVRMSTGEHRHVQIKKGDTVVLSSSSVPGNERAVDATINNLYREGAKVITNKDLDVHSSGHANREEMKMLIALLKPKYLIPIHGDYRNLVEHARLAQDLGMSEDHTLVIENGQVAEFDANGGRIAEGRVHVGQILIDGLGVGDVGQIVLRDRQTMAKDGIFLVIITVDSQKGRLVSSPDIISRGFVYMKENEDLISQTRDMIKKAHATHTGRGAYNWEYLKKSLRDDIGAFLFEKTQRQPMVIPVVIEV